MYPDASPSKSRAFLYSTWFNLSRSHVVLVLIVLAAFTGIGVTFLPSHKATLEEASSFVHVPQSPIARDIFYLQGAIDTNLLPAPEARMLSPELPKLHLFFLATETQQVVLPAVWYSWLTNGIMRIQERRFPRGTPSDLRTAENLVTVSYLHDANDILTGKNHKVCDEVSLACVSQRLNALSATYDFIWPVMPDAVPTGSADRLWNLLYEDKKTLLSVDRLMLTPEEQRFSKPLAGQVATAVEFGTGMVLRRSEIKLLEGAKNKTELSHVELMQSIASAIWGQLPSVGSVNLGFASMPPVSRVNNTGISWVMECPNTNFDETAECALAREGSTMIVNRTTLEQAIRNPLYFAARPFNEQSEVADCPKKLPQGSDKYLKQTWQDPTQGPKDGPDHHYGPEPAMMDKLHPDDADHWSPIKMYQRDSERPDYSSHKCGLKEFLIWRLGL